MLLAHCAMDDHLNFFARDASQAFAQSETPTQKPIFACPPKFLDILINTLLQVDLPLYGLPEAGLHWYNTYFFCKKTKLSLNAAARDPCFLFTTKEMLPETHTSKSI